MGWQVTLRLMGCRQEDTTLGFHVRGFTWNLTPRTPPSPMAPACGHSRLPQSRLAQLLQKFSRVCFSCNALA